MGSRTRQTRAVVSYKLDSSSDDSDDDVGFTVARSARNDSLRGSNNGEGEAGNCKGRRTLALKKKRSQDRGEARDVERVQRRLSEENSVRQQVDLSANLAPSTVPEDIESADRRLHQETKATAFQHLVDVAFEATDTRYFDTLEDGGGSVEDGRQMQSSVVGEENAHEPTEREKSNSSQADERELKLDVETTAIGEEGSPDAEPSAFDALRQRPKKSSKNNQAGSHDDDWLEEDVLNEGSSESASDFSSEDASDSDIDMEKKRQSTRSAAKKPEQSASRASVAKGPRIKSSAADRKVSSNSGQKSDAKKPVIKSVGRPRKIVSPSATSGSSRVEVPGATSCIPRLQPVKLRLKMASKEGSSDISPGGSSGGVPVQLISANNVQHRRVLGLSRRCRPPPLHPYLAGT